MRGLSLVLGLGGILVAAAAVFGRFTNADTITLQGHTFAAGTLLLVANTLLLTAVWLSLAGRGR